MLACEDEALIFWLNVRLVMNLGLDVFNPVIGINIERCKKEGKFCEAGKLASKNFEKFCKRLE